MHVTKPLAVFALLTSALLAQNFVSPSGMTNCYANGANAVPWGWPSPTSAQGEVFYQQIHDDMVGNVRVFKGFAFRHYFSATISVPWTYNVTVKVGDAATRSAGISLTFASNWKTGGAQTTVFSGPVTFPPVPAYPRPPAPPDAPLPFTVPHVYLGTDPLLWEAYITSTTPATAKQFHERGYVATAATYIPGMLGKGCTITGGGTPMDSAGSITPTTMTDNLSFGPPSSAAVLLLGDEADKLLGSIPLPINLAAIGSAGCFLHINAMLGISQTTSATGAATFTFPYTNSVALAGARLRTQWAAIDGANLVRTSNGLDYCIPYVSSVKAWPHQSVYSSNFGATPPATAFALYASGAVTVWMQ